MFINLAAAQRIFPLVKVLKIWKMGKHCVCVRYRSQGLICNTIVSITVFLNEAKELREKGAQKVEVFQFTHARRDSLFLTSSDSWETTYHTSRAKCSCQDWQTQNEVGNGFGRSVCKHQIAVAYKLGYSSFAEWAKNNFVVNR